MTAAAAIFVVAALASLTSSGGLVARVERIGARLGWTEALLGLAAALGANAPEITSASTALARHEHQIGVGVVLGSNVFNVAALLGVGALVSRRLVLHRRVVLLAGTTALWMAIVGVAVATHWVAPAVGLVMGAGVFVPYAALCAQWRALGHLSVGRRVLGWIAGAMAEEELELAGALDTRAASGSDVAMAVVAVGIVVASSAVMERAAVTFGTYAHWPSIVIGAVVLAAITSLPNAVAALHLARRARAAALLSEAVNSNNLNILLGLLVPGAIAGVGSATMPGTLTALWAVGLLAGALAWAFARRGLDAVVGAVVVAGYCAFVVALVAVT
ncbi:MAG: hypothetical protein ACYDD4_13100 [Acidimicrobiales bacterium]